MRRVVVALTISLVAAATSACAEAPAPSAEELAASASAAQGAFEAFDEACLGDGDLAASLPRAKQSGWVEFTPPADSMMGKHKAMLLDGPVFDRPEVVLLRKDSNRAQIAMYEVRTLRGTDYILHCEVVEESAADLDLTALEEWADVPIKLRQIDDSPEYYDLTGSRFADGGGGKATAYFSSSTGQYETLVGLIVYTVRSSFPEEGTD